MVHTVLAWNEYITLEWENSPNLMNQMSVHGADVMTITPLVITDNEVGHGRMSTAIEKTKGDYMLHSLPTPPSPPANHSV